MVTATLVHHLVIIYQNISNCSHVFTLSQLPCNFRGLFSKSLPYTCTTQYYHHLLIYQNITTKMSDLKLQFVRLRRALETHRSRCDISRADSITEVSQTSIFIALLLQTTMNGHYKLINYNCIMNNISPSICFLICQTLDEVGFNMNTVSETCKIFKGKMLRRQVLLERSLQFFRGLEDVSLADNDNVYLNRTLRYMSCNKSFLSFGLFC